MDKCFNKTYYAIQKTVVYPVDSVIDPSNDWGLYYSPKYAGNNATLYNSNKSMTTSGPCFVKMLFNSCLLDIVLI